MVAGRYRYRTDFSSLEYCYHSPLLRKTFTPSPFQEISQHHFPPFREILPVPLLQETSIFQCSRKHLHFSYAPDNITIFLRSRKHFQFSYVPDTMNSLLCSRQFFLCARQHYHFPTFQETLTLLLSSRYHDQFPMFR